MGACITGSGGLHKSAILHIPGSTWPAEMSGRIGDIVLFGIGKNSLFLQSTLTGYARPHLCIPDGTV